MYGKLAVALVLLVALVGAYVKGRNDGGKIVQADYAQRDLKAANDYAQKEREITEKYRSQEAQWQQQFVAASRSYQKGLARVETQRLADAAAVDAGRIRLLDPGTVGKACGDSPPSTTASTSGRNGSEGSELSGKAAKFLLSLASDADAVVRQLSACQQILSSERQ